VTGPETPYGLRLLPIEFGRRFGRPAAGVWRAPAAAALLTSAEAVLTIPLPWGAAVAAAGRADDVVALEHELRPAERLAVPAAAGSLTPPWARAALALISALGAGRGRVPGTSLLLRADLPPGLAIGPDPAIIAVLGRALRDLHRLRIDLDGLAPAVCASPWERVAVTTARHGRDGQAMLVDPATGSAEPVPCDLPRAGLRLLLADPGAAPGAATRLADPGGLPGAATRPADPGGRPGGAARPAGNGSAGSVDRVRHAAELLRAGDLSAFGGLLTDQYRSVRAGHWAGSPVDRGIEAALRAGALGAGLLDPGPAGRRRPMLAALVPAPAVRAVRAAVRAELTTPDRRPEQPAPRFLVATASTAGSIPDD
jgi:galactokinase